MGWRGIAIGGYIGSLFGGPLGAMLGAALGHSIEKRVSAGSRRRPSFGRAYSQDQRSKIFCASAAAMFAKMAKADGRVTQAEIDCVEQAFRRLGFTPAARAYAIGVFRRAKDDAHTIGEYAREFADAVDSLEVRELFYEILWDIAGADGVFSSVELRILQRIPAVLGIRPDWYAYFASQRLGGGSGGASAAGRDPLADAYSVLGAKASDDAATLRRRYRELAKRNHPDSLRAQGLPEEMVGKATERMSRINAAWATVKEARGI
ncbi:MAG: co-chaperone DjlA [Kiritimatiellae bacterium]|nr:co-chaperone DjlA [Kiritimatiellia bacterium]